MGRSFWILDDLEPLIEYQAGSNGLDLFVSQESFNASWGSQLDETIDTFKGSDDFEGVNPANGVVLYYNLPKLEDSVEVTIDVENSKGKVIRSFTSITDTTYIPNNGGGPPPAPVLSKTEGLNRLVWDMGYPIMPGIPNTYIEANFRGHKAPPGNYVFRLSVNNKEVVKEGRILETPGFETAPGQYEAYDLFMVEMESTLTEMHHMVNRLYQANIQLSQVLDNLKESEIKQKGRDLSKRIRKWDEDMIQRKSKAYDDVENFPNKFSAEYLFLINETSSSIPRVNTSNRNRKVELDRQWEVFKSEGNSILKEAIPEFNKNLWELGIGAIRY